MSFNEQVMSCEFEKAERMLKRAEKLIKKAKQQAINAVAVANQNLTHNDIQQSYTTTK